MSLIMVSCFLIAWTPYAIMAMGATYGSPDIFTPTIAALPALFAKTSNCYNPIIYVFMNKQVGTYMDIFHFPSPNDWSFARNTLPDKPETQTLFFSFRSEIRAFQVKRRMSTDKWSWKYPMVLNKFT